MSFVYPLFLFAAGCFAIPVLIHLFNLRKYKVVFFSNTRFLKNIQLTSRKQSKVQYKLLLATRLLFLASLILAFAQPFFDNNQIENKGNKLHIIYIDNSYSMSVLKGPRSLLDMAKENVTKQVRTSKPGTRFIVVTNDKPFSFLPEPVDKVLEHIQNIDFSSSHKTVSQILTTSQSFLTDNINNNTLHSTKEAELYYYSDFQNTAFPNIPEKSLTKNITFYGIPIQTNDITDLYIDTAFFTLPILQTGKNNYLVVKTKAVGKLKTEQPVLQLNINGQVKSAVSLNFKDKDENIDTLSFQVSDVSKNGTGFDWQYISLILNDGGIKFDDTFRIAARSSSNLSVLILNEGTNNPYLLAAFRAYNGFKLNQSSINKIPENWKSYNLTVLNGITKMDEKLGKTINEALQQGQSICFFPGKTTNYTSLNTGIKQFADIQITGLDTSVQTASTIQQGSNLVKDIFEKLPENVQLPVANWHYNLSSGLSANQQSILSFRNGDPFFAKYTPSKGQLYLCTTSADMQSGNFPGSYFFTPFLYEMAMQAGSGSIFAITAGTQQPVYISLSGAMARNTIHIYGKGLDLVPPQSPFGTGLQLFLDPAIQQPGFYKLAAEGTDTTVIALNEDKSESLLTYRNIDQLKQEWKGDNIIFPNTNNGITSGLFKNTNEFPIWMVCILLALFMLFLETILLAVPSSNLRTHSNN